MMFGWIGQLPMNKNSKQFDVERSDDGTVFRNVGEVSGCGK
jgi:hypothetical protein